jgi:hypothetical protein
MSVTQYGYSSSYLGFLVEIVREVFPFGASAPDKKHYYTVVLHITPEAIQRHSVDNFQIAKCEAHSTIVKPFTSHWE